MNMDREQEYRLNFIGDSVCDLLRKPKETVLLRRGTQLKKQQSSITKRGDGKSWSGENDFCCKKTDGSNCRTLCPSSERYGKSE